LSGADAEIGAAVEQAAEEFGRLGCRISRIDVPELEAIQEASVVITSSEAVTYHDPMLRSHPEAYGPLVRSRLESGYQRTALEYLRAMEMRAKAEAVYARVFMAVDCLLGACLPVAPPPIGEQQVRVDGREMTVVEAFTRFNSPQNMAGVPALSLPCGFSQDGLPVGLQLIGPVGRDDAVLGLGMAYQRVTDWHQRRPPGVS
jgi:aspartyl-tRNA(Asn)/glutamyl-tRNA(Gln) amidotransferase subunit A